MRKEKLVIELGSTNTVIYKQGYGIVLREPSALTINSKDCSVVDAGLKAKKMQGKVNESILYVEPIENGIITDEKCAELMLDYFLNKVITKSVFAKISATFCVSIGLDDNQLMAYKNIAYNCGIDNVEFVNTCSASLIGADSKASSNGAVACVNIGGGTVNMAVISYGNTVDGFSLTFGGKDMDNAIIDYVKGVKGIEISQSVAEKIKNECGSLYLQDTSNMEIVGSDCETKKPVSDIIASYEVREAVSYYFDTILKGIEHLLHSCSADIIKDIMQNGLYLTGGVANFTGLENYLTKALNLRVIIPDEPENCAVLGAGLVEEKIA